jgi:hypothetical protein
MLLTRCRVLPLALALTACTAAPPELEVMEVAGECGMVYGGNVCTWAEMQGDSVLSVGATIPMATVSGVPAEMEMTWPPTMGGMLMLPAAAQQATGMSHLTVFWEAHGHPPGPFLTPHFDFHFYGISPADREAIDCLDVTKPTALPAGYELPDEEIPGIGMLVGVCVPTMGMHSLLSSSLAATDIFDATMVVGWIKGQPIFVEPMISKAFLERREGFSLPIPALPATGGTRYPTGFEATYDAATQAYRFSFTGLGN